MSDLLQNQPRSLPGPIIMALNQLIRRARNLIIIRGVCASCAAGLGAFLVVMLFDAVLTLLVAWPRWVLSLSAYACWAGTTYWYLVRPLARSFSLTGIARLIENHHPELQERLSSVVELLASKDIPSIRGSEVLIQALTEEAVRGAVSLRPRHEISFRRAIPFGMAAGLMVAVLTGLGLVMPRQTGFLMARAAAPFLNLPNVRAVDLVVKPGDALVAAGGSLEISLQTLNPVVSFARLRMTDSQGRETVADMLALPVASNRTDRCFAVTLPGVLNEFRYRVQAGDAVSRFYTVRVAVPPVIKQQDIHYRYPEYSGLPPRLDKDGSGTIRALAGTEVTVAAQVNKAVQTAVLEIHTGIVTNTIKGILRMDKDAVVYDFSLVLPKVLTGAWTLRLTDEIGLCNSPFERSIQSIPDAPPVVMVSNPRQRELRLNRDTRLPVFYAAEDDLGLQAVALVFSLPGNTNELIRSLPLPEPAPGHPGTKLAGETVIDLQDSLFTNAPRFSVRLRAVDRLPANVNGPQTGHSDIMTIILDSAADSWQEQVLASQDKRVAEGLKLIQQQLAKAREQSVALNDPLAKQPALTAETSRKIDALQDVLASAENSLRDTAQELEKGFFEALATNLNALAVEHVAKAENLAGQIKLVDNPAERMAVNSNVTTEISTSLGAVEKALRDHEQARAAARRAVELDEMSGQQDQLARERRALENADRAGETNAAEKAAAEAAEKEWAKDQDKVADDLARMTRETPEAAAEAAGAVSNRSARAAVEADQLARRQAELEALTREALEQQQKQEAQWRDLAARQDKLAESVKAEPRASLQSDAMKKAAREMEAGLREQARNQQKDVAESLRKEARELDQPRATASPGTVKMEGQPPAAEKPDPFQELADKAGALKTQQEKTDPTKAPSPAEAARESARTAEQAGQLSEQAAQSAEKAAQQAAQSARKAQEQAEAAKAAAQQADQAAKQAGQAAQQSQGKPNEQEAKRAAEAAQQNAQAARENETEARQDAQDAKGDSQNAQRESQQARNAAAAAKQSAQQAAQQAQQAAAANSPSTANQKKEAAAAAAKAAVSKAMEAAQAAMRANESAEGARREADSAALADMARRQDELRREADALLAMKRQHAERMENRIARQVEARERDLAQAAEALAQAMNRQTAPEGVAEQASAAARAARQAADELQQDKHSQAQLASREAERALEQLTDQLRNAVRGMRNEPLEKRAAMEQFARQARELEEQQEQLGKQIGALAADQPLDALQGQQEQVTREATELTQEAASIQAQAGEAMTQPQGARPAVAADQAAQAMQRAQQAAGKAGQQMQAATGQKSADGKSPSPQAMQQAAQQAGQNQQVAAQAMQQAAQSLRQAAQAAAAAPAQPDQSSLSEAQQSARGAAQSRESADAAEAAAQVAAAAQQAAGQARAMGINPRPSTLRTASSNGTGSKDMRTESEEIPSFARRLGLRLQDWLKLHGELKDDVLQAINNEGPEEYRPIIQKYFREVSRHGEEK
jgi:hypothetical protein